MGDFLVRNIDDEALALWKQRAAVEKRSLNDVLRECIESGAKPDRSELLEQLSAFRRRIGRVEPAPEELIRQDRDNR